MRRFRTLLGSLALGVVLTLPGAAEARKPAQPVSYTLEIPDPATQYVHVTMQVPKVRKKRTRVVMPAWAPGSYKIRDFGRHVFGVRALAEDGSELPLTRVDKQTWEVENRRKPFTLHYRVFADELGVRTSYLNDTFALLNGTSIFMYVERELDRPTRVTAKAPSGWSVHTAMKRSGDAFLAADYDTLADSPLLLGTPTVHSFEVQGAKFNYVFAAPSGTNADPKRLAEEAEKVVSAFGEIMGGFAFNEYSFLVVADPHGGGGLEHFDSTAMLMRPWRFDSNEGYKGAARLAAHEFFHNWNVKRIHDEVLGPFDYTKENYSELLWFHEGFTETMEGRAMRRAGLVEPDAFLSTLGEQWTRYQARPGRDVESIAQISKNAWITGYQWAANHRNVVVSYYTKGNYVGLCLDLEIRLHANAAGKEGSLDGVFRRLWDERKPGSRERAIDYDDIVDAASAEAGVDMRPFFDAHVRGTTPLDLPGLLKRAGFVVESRRAWESEAGKDDPERAELRAYTGIVGRGQRVDSIDPGSPAQKAGLMIGDEIVAVDGKRVRSLEEAKAHIGRRGPGKAVALTLFRRDRLERIELSAVDDPRLTWTFAQPEDGQDQGLAAVRRGFLAAPAQATAKPPAKAGG